MTNFDPLHDKLDVYSAALNALAEVNAQTLLARALTPGTNITLTPNSDGTTTIAATGSGASAADGNLVVGAFSGVAPGSGVGLNGDYALDTSDGWIYGPKAAGAWPSTPVYTPRGVTAQVFASAGTFTYTPTAGTKRVIVEVVGGGAAGGGAPATASSAQVSVASPGGAGAYGKGLYTSGFSGVTITVGAAGNGVTGGNGGNGGTSSFGSLLSAPGGVGGNTFGPLGTWPIGAGGTPSGVATGGNIVNSKGAPGQGSLVFDNVGDGFGADGGWSFFGAGGAAVDPFNNGGNAAGAPGGGGSGTCNAGGPSGALTGGNGIAGAVIVWEYS